MAIKFSQSAGGAKKSDIKYFEFRDGANKFRMVGDLLPRYMYWVPGAQGKNIPFECLAFDREAERFTNVEKDHVRDYLTEHYGEDKAKCSWGYSVQVIDLSDGAVKVMSLKKKMFEQIRDAAEHLGDPTDPDEGWNIVVKRRKTGPHAFNVEYTLDQFACKKEPLTDEQRELVSKMKPIDELFPRPTPEDQKKALEALTSGSEEEKADEDVANEFNPDSNNDDIPF